MKSFEIGVNAARLAAAKKLTGKADNVGVYFSTASLGLLSVRYWDKATGRYVAVLLDKDGKVVHSV
jgi:hypothetical protein